MHLRVPRPLRNGYLNTVETYEDLQQRTCMDKSPIEVVHTPASKCPWKRKPGSTLKKLRNEVNRERKKFRGVFFRTIVSQQIYSKPSQWLKLGLSIPLVLHFRIFGSIFSEYSVIRRIWACHGRGSINGRGHKLNIYLKKK